jgi:hypothetical protein
MFDVKTINVCDYDYQIGDQSVRNFAITKQVGTVNYRTILCLAQVHTNGTIITIRRAPGLRDRLNI